MITGLPADPAIRLPGLHEVAFLERLQDLVAAEVARMGSARSAEVLRAAADAIDRGGAPVQCRIVPFVPMAPASRRAAYPGLGSSEAVGLILAGDRVDPAYLLCTLSGYADARATVSFTGPDGRLHPTPVPGGRTGSCPREPSPSTRAVCRSWWTSIGRWTPVPAASSICIRRVT